MNSLIFIVEIHWVRTRSWINCVFSFSLLSRREKFSVRIILVSKVLIKSIFPAHQELEFQIAKLD